MRILQGPAPHVLVYSFEGKIEKADIEQTIESLESALAQQDRVHLLTDLSGVDGITPEAVFRDLTYGLSSLGRLYRFGRLAVVTDSPTLANAAQLEGKLLPSMQVRAFGSGQRDEAMSWVAVMPETFPAGLEFSYDEGRNLLILAPGDEVTGFDIRSVGARIRELYRERGPVSLLLRMEKRPRFGPGLFYEKAQALDLIPMLAKYAIVGPEWLRGWVSTAGFAFSTRAKYFPPEEADQALAWLSDSSPSVQRLPSPSANLALFRTSGKVTEQAVRDLYGLLMPSLRGHDSLDVYIELQDYEGMTLKGCLEAFKQGFSNARELLDGVRRFAVVTDKRFISSMVKLENRLLPQIEERAFSFSEREQALQWLEEGRSSNTHD